MTGDQISLFKRQQNTLRRWTEKPVSWFVPSARNCRRICKAAPGYRWRHCVVGVKAEELTITQTLLGYSTRTSFMTAPDGFWVSTSAFPFIANSYWLLEPMANALFATMAFVVSMWPVSVYVPVLR